MRIEYENFVKAIEAQINWQTEYETTHDDAAGDYEHMVPDSVQYNNGKERMAEFMALHNIEGDPDSALDYCIAWGVEAIPHSGCSNVQGCFYSKDECHHSLPTKFVLSSYSIDEIEVQIELSSLPESLFQTAFVRKALDDNRLCIREIGDCILSYEATDASWVFVVDLETLQDWAESQAA